MFSIIICACCCFIATTTDNDIFTSDFHSTTLGTTFGMISDEKEVVSTSDLDPRVRVGNTTMSPCYNIAIVASLLSAIASGVFATVIFVAVQIIICKFHQKFQGTNNDSLQHEYAEIDGGIQQKEENNHTYAVVKELTVNTAINEAYDISH
jgi:hypothetical protein